MSRSMTVVTPPRLGVPYWTAYSPVEGDSAPVDALRFETYAERLGNRIFPGITNRVERVRYFGMVCAGIEAAREEVGSRVSGREHTRRVRERFTRFEAAWAYAQVAARGRDIKIRPEGASRPRLRDEFRGLRGANRVLSYWDKTHDQEVVDGRGGYRLLQAQESQGGLGAYLVALREHGFVHPDRLELTTNGGALVQDFYAGCRRDIRQALAQDGRRSKSVWRRTGEHLLLSSPSAAERRRVHDAVFAPHGDVGRFIDLLPEGLRRRATTFDAFEHVAAGQSALADVARFALAFDVLRRNGLRLFARAGEALQDASTPREFANLLDPDERDQLVADLQAASRPVLELPTPEGLEPVVVLAAELDAASPSTVFDVLVAFHHREGRRWIESAGGRKFQLGMPGSFQDPGEGFHGFTLHAALSVYEDAVQVRP